MLKDLCEPLKIDSEIKTEDNYLLEPKIDGYRSHHIIFSFSPKDSERAAYTGRRIELQVRTQLQHSWATAIEAVGLFRGEQLKSDQGSREWLRLFKLMSDEFAEAERCPVAPGTPEVDPIGGATGAGLLIGSAAAPTS